MDGRAISEVAGTMVLIGVVVVGMMIVNLVIISTPTNTRIPSLQASMTNRSTLITIVHQGGDSIPAGQFKILVNGSDETTSFTNSGSFPWSVGETLSFNAPYMPQSAVMIYNGTGKGGVVILETRFPWGVYVPPIPHGSGGSGDGGLGSPITPTPTPTPPGPAWYDCSWAYRKNITINKTAVSATETNFPVLISLTDTDLRDKAQGYDILFTDSNGNKIPHEIENFTKSSGALVSWVKVPSLNSTTDAYNTSIFMYYGNPAASSQEDVTDVWTNGFAGVWHLNETVTDESTSGTHFDSTENGNNGAQHNNGPGTGQIDGAQDFDGSDWILGPDAPSLDMTSQVTMEAWVNLDNSNPNQKIVGKTSTNPGPNTGYGYILAVQNGHLYPEFWDNQQNGPYTFQSGTVPTSWTHLAVTWTTGDNIVGYVNGKQVNSIAASTYDIGTATNEMRIGVAPYHASPDQYFVNGRLDEIRLSSVARDADWIATEYKNQKDPSKFHYLGSEEGSTCGSTPTPMPTPTPSFPWYDCSWSYRKNITIDHSKVPATQTNFPVLVSLTSDDDLYLHALTNGNDILFTKSDGTTKIPHEIESYISGTGALTAWVNVSSLSSITDTTIMMYYGNPEATNQQDKTNVWDGNYKAVWHLSDAVVDEQTTGSHVDSTINALTASQNNNGPNPGQINKSQYFDGNDYISRADTPLLDMTAGQDFTISAWVKSTQAAASGTWPAILRKVDDPTRSKGYGLYLHQELISYPWYFEIEYSSSDYYSAYGNSNIADGTWHYIVGVRSGSTVKAYEDGAPADSIPGSSGDLSNTNTLDLAANSMSPPDSLFYTGNIDEVRISKVARSDKWIATEYNNTYSPNTFYSVKSQVSSPCYVTPTTTPTPAPWYDCSWQERKRITINHTEVPATQSDFPVLVSLASDTGLSASAQSDGDDILFTAADGTTKLSHETESYSSGTLATWVKVPSVSSVTDTYFYMYYGNPSSPSQQDKANVWTNGYLGVWHLNNAFNDSTSNGNHGANTGSTDAAGKIAQARGFDGNDYIQISGLLGSPASATLSAWVNLNSADTNGAEVVSIADDIALRLDRVNTAPFGAMGFYRYTSGFRETTTGIYLNGSGWRYVALVVNPSASSQKYYTGGIERGSSAYSNAILYNAGDTRIGKHGGSSSLYDFNGYIDEVRISNIARTAQWIQTEYNNQNSPSSFSSVAGEETATCTPPPTTPPTPTVTPTPSPPWFNCFWPYRKNITINKTAVAATQTDFPVLINLSSDGDLKNHTRSDGYDILFTREDGQTEIPYEREYYNNANGALAAWVKVPRVNSSTSGDAYNTTIYMYYGFLSSPDKSSPQDVWTNGFTSVWHLNQTTGGSEAIKDSTFTGNDGTDQGGPTLGAAGKMGNAITFDGSNDYISTKIQYSSLQTFTESLWFKTTNSVSRKMFGYETNQTGTTEDNWDRHLYIGTGGNVLAGIFNTSADKCYFVRTSSTKNDGNWHHAVMTFDSNIFKFYVDGSYIGQNTSGLAEVGSGYWRMGAYRLAYWPFSSGDGYFQGTLDEVRLSSNVRPDQWIATEYANQANPALFHYLGKEESFFCGGTSGPSYVQSRSLHFEYVNQASITLPGSTTTGNLLVLSCVINQSNSVATVTDSKNGNAYNWVQTTNVGTWGKVYTYNVPNSLGGTGPITATVSLQSPANKTFDVFFLEYSGVASTSPVDVFSSGSASSGTSMNTSFATTTKAPSLIYGFGAGDYSCHAAPPYTDRETANGRCAVDQTVFMTGTFNVTATQDISGNWALQMVAFKGA